MKLDDEVCSLELSKKLKELGAEQSSVFVWEYYSDECYSVKFFPFALAEPLPPGFKQYSAFNTAELLDMLPAFIDLKQNEPFNNFYLQIQKRTAENIKYIARYVCDSMPGEEAYNPAYQMQSPFKSHAPKLADCLAQLLISIKEIV